ncbi:MAG: DUF4406 domain-containing protein [Candidatus Daviesbacteria bacterium]|nr:DUF4406 domain-containing protein [Candidatus Daviesbacteria bacterium]
MNELIGKAVANADSLDEVFDSLISLLADIKDESGSGVAYVAGIVNSDGSEFRDRNIERLQSFTTKIGEKYGLVTFSAADLFPRDVFTKVTRNGFNPEEFKSGWKRVFSSGYIEQVFMTPRWEVSDGATDEHNVATQLGLVINYAGEDLLNNK